MMHILPLRHARRALGALLGSVIAASALAHCNALVSTPDGELRAAGERPDAATEHPDATIDQPDAATEPPDAATVHVSTCPRGTKACAQGCVPTYDPATGCDTASCGACNANAAAHCAPSGCVIDSCKNGFLDCNHDPSDGCEASPSFILSSASHCGACGHQCKNATGTGPGICQNGECESFVLAREQTYASTVVPDETEDGYLYFTNSTFAVDGRVARVRKHGGGPVDILYEADRRSVNAQGYLVDRPAGLVLDGDRIYWGTNNANDGRYGRVHWAHRDGTAHGSIGVWNGPASLTVDRGMLYFTNRWDRDVLLRIPTAQLGGLPDGGAAVAPTVVYSVPTVTTDTLGIRADFLSFGNVYFCALNGLWRANKTTLVVDRLSTTPCYALVLDSTFVYYALNGVVYRHDALTASKPEEIVIDLHFANDDTDHFTSVAAIDGRYLYVEHFDRLDSQIFRVSVDGKEVLRLASGVPMGAGLSVDPWAVYWSSQSTKEIRKIWK
jgi:hypothetical protein